MLEEDLTEEPKLEISVAFEISTLLVNYLNNSTLNL